ncbi:MAG: methionyl-tRNA synthetase [Lasallia pustulata]|uniref:Probable methionine--tRNA ligase, mitochondrial n=1 Tax=Lasallia pustulata TaxID=136370 RepID=A0A5M8PY83_9LECA|nr:MAG: methionyl-tRNA synthetase [Lasallia pustulata]
MGWQCRKCQSQSSIRRWYSTPALSRPEKPYYITTPIFYVNAPPYVGHLYTLVLTDILKRWQVLLGRKAILCTGTDEHGMKIQKAAAKAGQDVRAFCDKNYKSFDVLARRVGVDFNHFIRTSEPDHRFAVHHFWLMLRERGYIYVSRHEGWYSVSDETFYPESAVQLTLDPLTGRKFMASMETGKEVEWTSENNYHFRLSALKDRLLELCKENPQFVVPATRMNDVVQVVSSGLGDLSVSRPVERLTWGIPVPDDDTQTIYVWLDALINYLTKSNYPVQIPGQENAAGWPADVHVIGKDIVRFHCIYWPAFLMALDLPLPQQVLTHAHWTIGHEKMSKSTGKVVNPFFALDRFGVDTMRYYLAHDGGIRDDADYENAYIIDRYKKGLQGGLGNLVSRVMRGKSWNVREAIVVATNGDAPAEEALSIKLRTRLLELPDMVMNRMERLDSGAALMVIMDTIYMTNTYMQQSAPWDYKDGGDKAHLNRIIYLCVESIRICGILLQPYMPGKMEQLMEMLGVAPDARKFENAILGSDPEYGIPKVPLGKGREGVLFPDLRSDS